MNQLIYIPTQVDKKQMQGLLEEPLTKPTLKLTQKQEKLVKPLNKQELKDLLGRLTRATKKQYDMQQQATQILHSNKELQGKRLLGDKVENRLMAFGRQRDRKVVQLGQNIQQQTRQKYFRDIPQISSKGQSIKQPPIERRINELMSEHQIKKQELTVKYQPTFHPKVDPHSNFINDIENLGDLHNRMRTKEQEADLRKQNNIKKVIKEQGQELTFKPKINDKSRQIAESLPPKSRPGTSIHHRSQVSQVYPFAPTINKNTDRYLLGRDQGQTCFRRLYKQAKELTVKKEHQKQQRDRSRSFRPSINSTSSRIVNSRRQKDKKLETKTSNVISKDERDQSFQQIKIGVQVSSSRARTYSLRASKSNRHWIQEFQHPSSNGMAIQLKQKLSFIR